AWVSRTSPSTIATTCGSRATLARKLLPRSSMLFFSRITQPRSRVERSRDDRHVAGAAAEMPGKERADVGFVRVRIAAQISAERQEVAGGTDAARAPMMPAERLLQRRRPPGPGREAFARAQFRAARLHRQHQARARWHAVDLDSAGAAHAV